MSPGDKRFTIEWHQCGQLRAYADSVWDFTLTIEEGSHNNPVCEWVPMEFNEDLVKKYAKSLGRFWREKDDPETNWASPMLTNFTKISPGKWRICVTEAYTD